MRYLLTLIICLWLSQAWAFSGFLGASTGGSVPSCTTPNLGDEITEGFLGAGYENTWTVTANGATIDPDKTLTVGDGLPTGACTEGLNVISAAQLPTITWNRGTAVDVATVNIDTYLTVLVHSASLDDYSYSTVVSIGEVADPTSRAAWKLEVRRAAAVYYLQVTNTATTRVPISFDTWYTVKIHSDATAASSYVQITGGGSTTCDTEGECAFTTVDTYDWQYVAFQSGTLSGAETLNYEIGYISVDTP